MDESTQQLELETQYEWSIGLSLLSNDDDFHEQALEILPLISSNHININSNTSLLNDDHELFSDELYSNDIHAKQNNNSEFINSTNLLSEYNTINALRNNLNSSRYHHDNDSIKKTKQVRLYCSDSSSTDSSSDLINTHLSFHQHSSSSESICNNISPASSILELPSSKNRQKSSKSKTGNSSNNNNSNSYGKRKKASDYARRILMNWVNKNKDYPYPTRVEKTDLASRTGLTIAQIVHWMSNVRKRRLIPLLSGKRIATSKIDRKFLEEMRQYDQ